MLDDLSARATNATTVNGIKDCARGHVCYEYVGLGRDKGVTLAQASFVSGESGACWVDALEPERPRAAQMRRPWNSVPLSHK